MIKAVAARVSVFREHRVNDKGFVVEFPPDFFPQLVQQQIFSSDRGLAADICAVGGAKAEAVDGNEEINLCVLMPNLETAALVVSVGLQARENLDTEPGVGLEEEVPKSACGRCGKVKRSHTCSSIVVVGSRDWPRWP